MYNLEKRTRKKRNANLQMLTLLSSHQSINQYRNRKIWRKRNLKIL